MMNNRQKMMIEKARNAIEGAMMNQLFALGDVCLDCGAPADVEIWHGDCELPKIFAALNRILAKVK